MHDVRFGVLGPVTVWRDDEVVTPNSATHRALLGVLLLAENRPLPADRLLALLNPDAPRSWVQVAVSRLRTWLAKNTGETIEHRADGYLLEVPPDRVDLGRFRALYATAVRTDELEVWEQALSLWRGPVPQDHRIEQLRVEAALGFADAAMAAGDPRRALAQITNLTASYPLDERLHATCALLLAGSGRQSEALQLIENARSRLVAELGVDLGEHLRGAQLRVLRQQARPATPTAPDPVARWRGQRPEVTELVGRDRDRDALLDGLGSRRLVTIVGAGGAGKTTLALHVAEHVEARFTDGVVVVGLASMATGDEVVTALASLVEVSAPTIEQTLVALGHALAERHLLIVLDNCEHLAADCARFVRYFIDHAPRVVVLTTSRQPIGVVEEWIWPLGTLELPDAVALFRRRAAVPISDADLPQLEALCRRLDGLPLAIELAAARLPESSVAELDVGGTLHATIDWSYRLLTDDEQLLLARLSVFRTSFSLEAAEATCGAPPLCADDVLPILIALIDKSLVLSQDGRFRLLATVREFAAAQADASGTYDRQLDYWLTVGRELDALPHDRDRVARARLLFADGANIGGVLDHGFGGARAADAAELVVRMQSFWLAHRSYLGRNEQRLRQARETLESCSPEVRSLILYWSAFLLAVREDYVGARERMAAVLPEIADHRPREYREGTVFLVTSGRFALNPAALEEVPAMLATVGEHLDGDEPSTALTVAGGVYGTWGRFPEAIAACERYALRAARRGTPFSISHQVVRTELALGTSAMDEALVWSRLLTEQLPTAGNPLEQEPARRAIALVLLAHGDNEAALEFLTDSVAELERSYAPELARSAYLGILLAEALRRTGDFDRARLTLAGALCQAVRRTNLRVGFTGALAAALVAFDLGDTTASRELAGRWDGLRRRIGLPIPVGFTGAATVLGLEPGTPDPCWEWRAGEVQAVIDQALAYVAC